MTKVRNFSEANQQLAKFVAHKDLDKKSYTLDRMKLLMEFLGNPQAKLKIIHVAGTSGKTSTSYYIASLLQTQGQKIGLTVSPHIAQINERVQINGSPLDEISFCRDLSQFLDLVQKSRITPSYFELIIAFAYWEFANYKVDYAVIEVGLGGLLDGTNVADRRDKVCVITDIGLDHVDILGKTIPEIAAQKAGIIKNGNVVFTHPQDKKIMSVLTKASMTQKAQLNIVNAESVPADISFLPLFQIHNFTLAYAAANYVIGLDKQLGLKTEEIIKAAKVFIPARMEIIKKADQTIIIDGAHNQQKMHALVESIEDQFPSEKFTTLLSFLPGGEHRVAGSLRELIKVSSHIIITSFNGGQDSLKQSVPPELIARELDKLAYSDYEIVREPQTALATLLDQSPRFSLCVGSFYLLNFIRPALLEYQ